MVTVRTPSGMPSWTAKMPKSTDDEPTGIVTVAGTVAAVTSLLEHGLIARVENTEDRREFRLALTDKGHALYEELIPRLLRREQEILSCLNAQERKEFARLLGKIEDSLDLVQASRPMSEAEAY